MKDLKKVSPRLRILHKENLWFPQYKFLFWWRYFKNEDGKVFYTSEYNALSFLEIYR
jgi:hypothetical protein